MYGFNISVLIGVLALLFRRPALALQARTNNAPYGSARVRAVNFLNRYLVTFLILAVLVLYTLLVGASASVVRACIMGALVVIALELGRQSWAVNALAFSASVMTLLNPYVLWDVGFQLSFLATLGLLVYIPRWQNRIEGWLKTRVSDARARHIVEFLGGTVLVTAAAFLVTAPLLVVYFHRVSLIGFLTNLLILPVQPAIMLLGGAATLLQMLANGLNSVPFVGLVVGALAQVLAWGAYVCLQYSILVVQATAAVPSGSFEVARIDAPLVIVVYAVMLLVTWLGVKRTAQLLFARVWVPITVLALVTMFVWTTALASPDPRTRVSFIDAAEGDATFIRTANDQRILINGTGEPGVLLSYLGTQLPPWDRRLDLVIATHTDDDNLSSLNAVLERYNVGQVLEPPAPKSPGVSYAKWRNLIEKNQIAALTAVQGTLLRAGETTLEVIYPAPENAVPFVALRLLTDGRSFLLAPALRKTDRAQMVKDGALFEAEVAVLPSEIEAGWMERVAPSTVILFVGRSPREQPTEETLKLLEGVAVLRTDERGTITYILDEEEVEVRAEK